MTKMKGLFINSGINILGLIMPIFAGVIFTPLLLSNLGDDNFGRLMIIFALVSYSGVLDMGIGRVATLYLSKEKIISEFSSKDEFISFLMVILVKLSFFILAFGFFIIFFIFDEYAFAYFWILLCIPSVLFSSLFKGVLEANEKFIILNMIRVPFGVFVFLGPYLSTVFHGGNLNYVAFYIFIVRVVFCVVYGRFSLAEYVVNYRYKASFNLYNIYKDSFWITVSNTLSPLVGYLDRFIIASLLTFSSVSYYTVPQELITKLWIIPTALTSVLFPLVIKSIANKESYDFTIKLMILLSFILCPVLTFVYFFSYDILALWISKEFSISSFQYLKIFCIGIYFNCLAQLLFTYIQGRGGVKSTGVLCLIEIPLYLMLLVLFAHFYGLLGIAVSWAVRMVLDFFALFYLGKKMHV